MKHLYSLSVIFSLSALFTFSYGQTLPDYGKILYRVNAGGGAVQAAASDTAKVVWTVDQNDQGFLSPYLKDTVGNKTYGVQNATIMMDGTVPSYVFSGLLENERDIWNWQKDSIRYQFSVAAGKKVEVRLYFAELYFTSPGQRLFDVVLEDQTKETDLDVFLTAGGPLRGTMKAYQVTSDGTLNVDLVRGAANQPIINAIEIIEIEDAVIQSIFGKRNTVTIAAYPNPMKETAFVDLTNITAEAVTVFDGFGKEIAGAAEIVADKVNVNLASQPNGIYFVRVIDAENQSQTIRLIKQ